MAQTTTAITACNVQVYVDKSGGALTEITGSTNKASMNFSGNVGEASTFGSEYAIQKRCGVTVEVSLDIIYSTATDEGADILKEWFFTSAGAARSVQIDIPDSTVGSDRYAGEAILESLAIEPQAGEATPLMVSATIKGTGAWTVTTIAS